MLKSCTRKFKKAHRSQPKLSLPKGIYVLSESEFDSTAKSPTLFVVCVYADFDPHHFNH